MASKRSSSDQKQITRNTIARNLIRLPTKLFTKFEASFRFSVTKTLKTSLPQTTEIYIIFLKQFFLRFDIVFLHHGKWVFRVWTSSKSFVLTWKLWFSAFFSSFPGNVYKRKFLFLFLLGLRFFLSFISQIWYKNSIECSFVVTDWSNPRWRKLFTAAFIVNTKITISW